MVHIFLSHMLIHIFGNPDLPCDALPVLLLPRLKEAFSEHSFRFTDPNELDLPEEAEPFVAIDTVDGLRDTRVITLDEIAATRARSTAHDFDFASYLLLAKKLRPQLQVHIIGIPMHTEADAALTQLIPLIKTL